MLLCSIFQPRFSKFEVIWPWVHSILIILFKIIYSSQNNHQQPRSPPLTPSKVSSHQYQNTLNGGSDNWVKKKFIGRIWRSIWRIIWAKWVNQPDINSIKKLLGLCWVRWKEYLIILRLGLEMKEISKVKKTNLESIMEENTSYLEEEPRIITVSSGNLEELARKIADSECYLAIY